MDGQVKYINWKKRTSSLYLNKYVVKINKIVDPLNNTSKLSQFSVYRCYNNNTGQKPFFTSEGNLHGALGSRSVEFTPTQCCGKHMASHTLVLKI